MTRARFDKLGRRLPDTGRGCGCGLCEAEEAPRYERREAPGDRHHGPWSPARRALSRLIRIVVGSRPGGTAQPTG